MSKKNQKKENGFQFFSKKIPEGPGCYLFYDKNNELLYVGKALCLRKRVSSYFQKTKRQSLKTEVMVRKIARIETRPVFSEMEAFVLENNLIKEFRPRFNIKLRDDKNFVYLHLTNEEFPKMEITRRIIRDGSSYFGPKTSAKHFRETIRFCQKFFHVRMTKESQDYYPDLISGKYDISREEYLKNVDLMKRFLRGDTKEVVRALQEKMMNFAKNKNFEAAAKIRDLLQSIQISTEKQRVQFEDIIPRDFISFVRSGDTAYFVRLLFREGQLLDQNEVEFFAPEFVSDEELLEQFFVQFYSQIDEYPAEIYIPFSISSKILEFIGQEIEIRQPLFFVPERGDKKKVLDMATKNAEHFRDRKQIEILSRAENFSNALPELASRLDLPSPPRRIECFDISHFGGTSTVASQVVFVDGEPKKSEYRRFQIKTLPDGKIDDFASMTEILSRRFARKDDISFAEKFPDLIVIDGGKGQLSAVMKAVQFIEKEDKFPHFFDPDRQIIALAKQEEEIFRVGESQSLLLDRDSPALKLLQRIRDEAHRFAITYNRAVRQKKAVKSVLDEIPGIGGETKKKLLLKFGSVSGIREADEEELRKILTRKQFENLKKVL